MRFIIVDEEKGVFLGAYNKFAVFAENDSLGMTKAFSFDTKLQAQRYIDKAFKKDDSVYRVIEIDAKVIYVKVEDIIRQGYGKYTHYLMDNIPMRSEAIH